MPKRTPIPQTRPAPTLILILTAIITVGFASQNVSAQPTADQPAVELAITEITNLRTALADQPAGSPNRGQAIENILTAQRQLLQNFPTDSRAPLWQADLAFDLLFLAGNEAGLDLKIEFGLPNATTWKQFKTSAHEAFALADEASAGLADLVLDIEDAPDFQTDAKLQQQRRQIINDELQKRIPYLLATAQYFQAVTSLPRPVVQLTHQPQDSTELPAEYRARLEEVGLLADDLELVLVDPYRTRIRILAGAAAYRRGDHTMGERHFARAESNPDLSESAQFRIHFTRKQTQVRPASTPAWLHTQPFWLLLTCDCDFRNRLGEIPNGHWESLLTAYDPFLNSIEITLSRGARERAVGEQVSHALPLSLPTDQLPAIVLLAQTAKQLSDPATRPVAITALESLAARTDTADWVNPRARYLIASAILADGDRLAAAQAYYELANESPTNNDGRRALEQALIILATDLQTNDSDTVTDLFESVSSLALHEVPDLPNYHQWMFIRGRFELARQQFNLALESFRLIPADSPYYLDASIKIAQSHYHGALAARAKNRVPTRHAWPQAIATGQAAYTQLQTALAQTSDQPTRGQYETSLDTILTLIADAQLRHHDPAAALTTINRIDLPARLAGNRAAGVTDLLRIHVDALLALNRHDEADAQLQQLAADAPARALPILTRMIGSLYTELTQLEATATTDEQNNALVENAKTRFIPLTKLALSIAENLNNDSPNHYVLRFHAGEAHRLAGDYPAARRLLYELKISQPNSADVLTAYAETCYQLLDDTESLRSFTAISQSLINDRTWRFWLAELRTLQILDRAQKRTERIFPRIQRLKKYDPQLGGLRFHPTFLTLENRHAP